MRRRLSCHLFGFEEEERVKRLHINNKINPYGGPYGFIIKKTYICLQNSDVDNVFQIGNCLDDTLAVSAVT